MNARLNSVLIFGAAMAAADLSAQAASSRNYVLSSNDRTSGGTSQSSNYRLHGVVGFSTSAGRGTSASHIVEAGHAAMTTVPTSGAPWITAVRPLRTPLRGKANLQLFGTELDLGPAPVITIGGQTATIGSRTRGVLNAQLPIQPVPGWQPVEIRHNLGTTVLRRGIGILPMVETESVPASGVPFSLVFRGTKGDRIVWAIGLGSSTPSQLPGIFYGFALNPSLFIVLSGLAIAGDDGVLRLPFPATAYPTGKVYIQAMFISTNPGYAPAAFSNVVRL